MLARGCPSAGRGGRPSRRRLSSGAAAAAATPRAVPASAKGRLARGSVPHSLAPTGVPWGDGSGLTHAPSSLEAVEDVFYNVDVLQARADQPPLHELVPLDWAPPSKQQRAQMAMRRRQEAADSSDSTLASAYKGYGLTNDGGCPVHPVSSAAVLLPVLKSLAAGGGLSVLRLGSSPQLRRLLAQRSPHDLALVAVGASLSLGTHRLPAEHCLHVAQSRLPAVSRPWPPWPSSDTPPPDVSLVACIQNGTEDDDAEVEKLDESPDVRVDSGSVATVWATPVKDLLDEINRRDPDAAQVNGGATPRTVTMAT
jgi:hypothetical protein